MAEKADYGVIKNDALYTVLLSGGSKVVFVEIIVVQTSLPVYIIGQVKRTYVANCMYYSNGNSNKLFIL